MIMLTEAIRLTVFPAVMAFAALSDLFTMTIANRVSLVLVGGFALLAALGGMSVADVLSHASAAASVLVVTFVLFACGWIGGGDAKLAAAAVLWIGFAHLADYLLYASLLGGALTAAAPPVSRPAAAADAGRPPMGRAPAPPRRWRTVRHRARGGGALGLSADRVDDSGRRLVERFDIRSPPSR